MKRYKSLFECEDCGCQDKTCPCQESCGKKKESCLCEACPENAKKSGGYCTGVRGEKLQGKCDVGHIWDKDHNKCIPLSKK